MLHWTAALRLPPVASPNPVPLSIHGVHVHCIPVCAQYMHCLPVSLHTVAPQRVHRRVAQSVSGFTVYLSVFFADAMVEALQDELEKEDTLLITKFVWLMQKKTTVSDAHLAPPTCCRTPTPRPRDSRTRAHPPSAHVARLRRCVFQVGIHRFEDLIHKEFQELVEMGCARPLSGPQPFSAACATTRTRSSVGVQVPARLNRPPPVARSCWQISS